MANMYRSGLSGGGVQPTGNAVAADVLTGKTFSNASAVGISGTMPNNGAVNVNLTNGQTYTVPRGYHNGNGTVTAPSGVSELTIGIGLSVGSSGFATLDLPSALTQKFAYFDVIQTTIGSYTSNDGVSINGTTYNLNSQNNALPSTDVHFQTQSNGGKAAIRLHN